MKVFSASRRGNPSVSLVNQYKEGRMEGFVNAKRAVFYVRHSFINNRAIISIFSCKVFNRWTPPPPPGEERYLGAGLMWTVATLLMSGTA